MKNSLQKTARWSALTVAMGFMSLPAFQAQAAIFWPGATGNPNKDVDYQEGYTAGQEDCRVDPRSCGVRIYPMIKDQGFGETEPNDHILNADGLLLGQFYHGNTLGLFDEDWYHVVTDKPSQKLTIYFLADAGNFTDTAGWIIQVRDLNGNIIAAFDSAASGGGGNTEEDVATTDANTPNPPTSVDISPIDFAKVTEVTLGKVGTYYISVKSKEDKGQLRGYNIAATLENTGQVTANPDENHFDTETEPNNDKANADPLRSNVVMTGVFNRTLVKYKKVTTPSTTEIGYFYRGCDIQNIGTIPPGQTNCECDLTSVDGSGNIIPPNPNTSSQAPGDACEARTVTIPATTENIGIFEYDNDTFVYHSEGNEQLRIQLCTRTDCQFDKVHLRVNKDNTGIVLMEGPVEPGQVIDLGAALQGDYYFELTAEEEGVISDTGDSRVSELVGPYDILLMSTKFKPGN